MATVLYIRVNDGQEVWHARRDVLKAAMLSQGWTISGHTAIEPDRDDPLEAYTALCQAVPAEEDMPDADDYNVGSLEYDPSRGQRTWWWWA
ncbi:MAG: hypothetical protein ACK53T_17700 [Planctomycetota bacterium]|jgi:hypothetical protein